MYNENTKGEQSIADELAIQNMFTALRFFVLTQEERELIEKAIKTHILENAKRVSLSIDSNSTTVKRI